MWYNSSINCTNGSKVLITPAPVLTTRKGKFQMAAPDSTSVQLPLQFEQWRDIPGYEGLYAISSFGTIKSFPRIALRKNGTSMPILGCILSQPIDSSGYCSVCLHKQGKRKTLRVHVLVALTFLGERPDNTEINHINGNKNDNNLANLEYCDHSRNVQHAYDHNLIPKGDKHYCAKLNWEKIHQIRYLSSLGISNSELGKQFGVSVTTIFDAVTHKTWRELP